MKLTNHELSRIGEDERWLATFSTPSPSREALMRVKQAVARELSRGQSRRPAGWHASPLYGVWAAAAMVLLSVGVVWRAELAYEPAVGRPASLVALERFTESLERLAAGDEWGVMVEELLRADEAADADEEFILANVDVHLTPLWQLEMELTSMEDEGSQAWPSAL